MRALVKCLVLAAVLSSTFACTKDDPNDMTTAAFKICTTSDRDLAGEQAELNARTPAERHYGLSFQRTAVVGVYCLESIRLTGHYELQLSTKLPVDEIDFRTLEDDGVNSVRIVHHQIRRTSAAFVISYYGAGQYSVVTTTGVKTKNIPETF